MRFRIAIVRGREYREYARPALRFAVVYLPKNASVIDICKVIVLRLGDRFGSFF